MNRGGTPEKVVVDTVELSPWEVHVMRTAVQVYLTDVLTGERVIITDQDTWVRHLSNVTRYLCGGAPDVTPVLSPAELKLKTVEEFMRNHATATGDWSLASPVLEILSGDY
jgi:hypothetical protein